MNQTLKALVIGISSSISGAGVILASLPASAQERSSFSSQAAAVQAADQWGEPVEGVQLRLALATSDPLALPGEIPALDVQIRNRGLTAVTVNPETLIYANIEIDDVWYVQTFATYGTGQPVVIAPGSQSNVFRRDLNVSPHVMHANPARAFELRPGPHHVRVRNLTGTFNVHTAAGKEMVLVSNRITIDIPQLSANAQRTSCAYRSKAGEGSMIFADRCGEANDSEGLSLLPEVAEDLYFDKDGLSCVMLSRDEAYLVHRNGRSARGPVFDTLCPWFEEGLSIGMVEGRQVYMDKGLNVALDPGYELLSHFQNGYARVCDGPFRHEKMGEKTRTTGGMCGMIDRSGKLVMDLVYPSEEYAAFSDFRNANNGCPAPPIQDRHSALCHAQRHAFSENWTGYSIEPVEDRWEVAYSFLERNRERTYTMHLGREKADVRRHEVHGLGR